jgi:MraZ protein
VRYVLGSAVDLEPDRAGRILIPSELRQMCALDREIALIGMGEHFELWDRSTLEALAAGLDAADFSF